MMNEMPVVRAAHESAAAIAKACGHEPHEAGTRRLAEAITGHPAPTKPIPTDSGYACPICGHHLRRHAADVEGDPGVVGGLRTVPPFLACDECDYTSELQE